MFKSKTLFIVGAGASEEAGLPTSTQLKSIIADKINIRFGDWGRDQISGDYRVTEALREHVRLTGSQDINPYLHIAWTIRDAMPQALSIDNYMDAHQEDDRIQFCGKLGITESILDAERKSKIAFKFPDERKPDLGRLTKTWYSSFFQLLTENVRKTDIDSLFKNVSFITFNYDRCIQHFLVHALQNYYCLSEDRAQQLVDKIVIVHPFGTVGRLPWQATDGIAFGAEVSGAKLLQQSSQIKTFTERFEDENALNNIRRVVQEAETIVSLGFAFHRLNMELIKPNVSSQATRVYGTAFSFSDSDCEAIENDIRALLQRKPQHIKIQLRNKLKCYDLFGEYWRTLSL